MQPLARPTGLQNLSLPYRAVAQPSDWMPSGKQFLSTRQAGVVDVADPSPKTASAGSPWAEPSANTCIHSRGRCSASLTLDSGWSRHPLQRRPLRRLDLHRRTRPPTEGPSDGRPCARHHTYPGSLLIVLDRHPHDIVSGAFCRGKLWAHWVKQSWGRSTATSRGKPGTSGWIASTDKPGYPIPSGGGIRISSKVQRRSAAPVFTVPWLPSCCLVYSNVFMTSPCRSDHNPGSPAGSYEWKTSLLYYFAVKPPRRHVHLGYISNKCTHDPYLDRASVWVMLE